MTPQEINEYVNEVLAYGEEKGFYLVPTHLQRFAITRMFNRGLTVQVLKDLVDFSIAIVSEPYAPQVYNFVDLERKLPKLKAFHERHQLDNAPKGGNIPI